MRAATCQTRACKSEVWSRNTSDRISQRLLLLEGLHIAVGGKRGQVAGMVEVKLSRVRLVITAAMTENEGTISETICGVQDVFLLSRRITVLNAR